MFPVLSFLLGCSENFIQDEDELIWGEPSAPIEQRLESQTDIFRRAYLQPLDVLFVIDNSGSMEDNHVNIAANISEFISVLNQQNIDYHIGVTSTDNSNADNAGVIVNYFDIPYLTPQVENGNAIFGSMLTLNLLNGGGEAGIDAMYAGMTINKSENKGFFRREAPLHIINISDEEDQSIHWSLSEFIKLLQEYQAVNKATVNYSSIVTFPGQQICNTSGESVGWRYIYTSKKIGGDIINICKTDWPQIMSELAEYSTEMYYRYPLTNKPIEDSIEVYIKEGFVTISLDHDAWIYDAETNTVELLDYQPVEMDLVVIEYLKL